MDVADMTVAETEVVAVDVEEVPAEDMEVADVADINLSSNMHLNLYLSLNFKILHFNQSLPFSKSRNSHFMIRILFNSDLIY